MARLCSRYPFEMARGADHNEWGSLRLRLREETREPHERLDALVSDLELGLYEDITAFVSAHLAAFQALDKAFEGRFEFLSSRLSATRRDLSALGVSPASMSQINYTGARNELGILYVVAGSHLGGRLLSKQIEGSGDNRVRPLELFDDPKLPSIWSDLVTDLKARPAIGDDAEHILAAARDCFTLFQTAFELHLNNRGAHDDR